MGAGGLVARLVAPACSKTMVRLRQVASGCARLRGCVFCQNSGQVAFQVARNLCPSLVDVSTIWARVELAMPPIQNPNPDRARRAGTVAATELAVVDSPPTRRSLKLHRSKYLFSPMRHALRVCVDSSAQILSDGTWDAYV